MQDKMLCKNQMTTKNVLCRVVNRVSGPGSPVAAPIARPDLETESDAFMEKRVE